MTRIAALEVSYGRGRIFLYGFKPQQRGQAHGTYRYLFNALYQFDDPPMPAEVSVSPLKASAEASATPEEVETTAGRPASERKNARSGGGTAQP